MPLWIWPRDGCFTEPRSAHGRPVAVKVVIYWGGLSELDGKCLTTVGGTEIAVVGEPPTQKVNPSIRRPLLE